MQRKTDALPDEPLLHAIKDGNEELVHYLLFEAEADVNMEYDDGRTPLDLAANLGNETIIDHLLRAGANVNSIHSIHRKYTTGREETVEITPLRTAIYQALRKAQHPDTDKIIAPINLSIIQKLIDAHADVDIGNPLMEVADGSRKTIGLRFPIIKALLDAGANPNCQDFGGNLPLTSACRKGHTEIANILLNGNANPEECDRSNTSPLMWAARGAWEELIDLLLSRLPVEDGITKTINAQNRSLETALITTIKYKRDWFTTHKNLYEAPEEVKENEAREELEERVRIVEKLIKAGADVTIRDKQNKSALDYAIKHQVPLVKLLTEHGSSQNLDEKQAEIESILRNANVRISSQSDGYLGNNIFKRKKEKVFIGGCQIIRSSSPHHN